MQVTTMPAGKITTTLQLPRNLYHRLNEYAHDMRTSKRAIIEEAVSKLLAEVEKETAKK